MKNQKFKKGDLVRITGGRTCVGSLAVVEYSYAEKYGGDDTNCYSLYVEDGGRIAWFFDCNLVFVSEDGEELKQEWEKSAKLKKEAESNWENIYDQGLEDLPNNTCVHLWENVMDYGCIRGKSGEGFVAYMNMDIVNHAYKICKEGNYAKESLPYIIQEVAKKAYRSEWLTSKL